MAVEMERASILHKKECPYGHNCMTSDCMECMEIYEKVDGLDTESADTVKEVRKDV